MTPDDYETFITNLGKTDVSAKLPSEYYDLAGAFKHESKFKLQPHSQHDHAINLKPGPN
ncbi:hypothetical protein LTR95_007923, partial [Oleoguttula sp. CCFEE 5521]